MSITNSLAEIQCKIQNAIQSGVAPDVLLHLILEKPPLTIAERIGIYQDAYFIRLAESLKDDFSECLALMGVDHFESAITEFIRTHPSKVQNLAEYSADFPEFLRTRHPEIHETARKEWLTVLSLQAGEPRKKITAEDIAKGLPFLVARHPSSIIDSQSVLHTLAYRTLGTVNMVRINASSAALLDFLGTGRSLSDIQIFAQKQQMNENELTSLLAEWMSKEIIYCEEPSHV
jgi:hypothetical protein